MTDNNDERNVNLCVPFASADSATLAATVLCVDKELKSNQVRREIATDGATLIIKFYGPELKMLRVAVNSNLKNITLIVKTLSQFEDCI